jgi:hypothetical protein
MQKLWVQCSYQAPFMCTAGMFFGGAMFLRMASDSITINAKHKHNTAKNINGCGFIYKVLTNKSPLLPQSCTTKKPVSGEHDPCPCILALALGRVPSWP